MFNGGGRYWKYQRIRFSDACLQDNVRNGIVLTKSEKEEVDEFYRPFFYIRYSAHEFYKSALGYFDKTFIPNGIHSAIIDRFYNDWGMASVLDNKCYYPYMFENVSMPKMIAYRFGGVLV